MANPISISGKEYQLEQELASLQASQAQVVASNDLLFILTLVLVGLLILAFLLWFLWLRHRQVYKIGVHMPDNRLVWHNCGKFGDSIQVRHGKDDIFIYLVDPDCISYGKVNFLQYYYKNPHPIKFDRNLEINVASVKTQNIDKVLRSDVIKKFVLSATIMGTLEFVLFALLIIGVLSLAGEYFIYQKAYVCNLVADENTIALLRGVLVGN